MNLPIMIQRAEAEKMHSSANICLPVKGVLEKINISTTAAMTTRGGMRIMDFRIVLLKFRTYLLIEVNYSTLY